MRRKLGLLVLLGSMAAPAGATAAPAAEPLVAVSLADGSRLVGRIVAEDEGSVTVVTPDGLRAVLPRASIVSTTAAEGGRRPSADPNYSRLMFAPTARPLRKGDGYFSDYELLFPGVAYGITDNLSLAGGLSVIPGLGFDEQVFYVSPKLGFELGDRAAVAVGGLFAGSWATAAVAGDSARIGFVVGTFGGPRRSVTLGLGIGDTSDSQDAVPILMAGGTIPLSRRTSRSSARPGCSCTTTSGGRSSPSGSRCGSSARRLSADVGMVLVGEMLDEGFPMPWLSVTYHFGKAPRLRARRSDAELWRK